MLLSEEAELTDIGCPGCGSTDWIRDGYSIYPGPGGTIARRRFAPSGHATERRWQCRGCATAIDDADALSARLSRIQATHFE